MDLQKQNFLDALRDMVSVQGWAVLEADGFLALKSPARIPLINFVWAEASSHHIQKARTFFAGQAFSWLLKSDQDGAELLNTGLIEPELFPEMLLSLGDYQPIQIADKIKTIEVVTEANFQTWAEVASETFELKVEDLKDFFQPLIIHAGSIPFLTFYENEPAATSLVYCGVEVAGVYAMSTREKFRRKGLGWAAAQACVEKARQCGMTRAVLYASELGRPLYEKMGFQVTQVLQEYMLG